jgi:hypothetical protein
MCRFQESILLAKVGELLRSASLAVIIITLAVSTSLAEDKKADLGPGCAPDRPAIAHHASGVLANLPPGQAKKAPIPCLTNTGWRTQELSIVFTNKGTLLVTIAFPAEGSPLGVIRSVDDGRTWNFIDPNVTPARVAVEDMNLWVDRDTGRVFWNSDQTGLKAFGIPSRDGDVYIDHSDDDGKSWVRSSPLSPQTRFDHAQIFTGPPPKSVKNQLKGYPNIVYVSVAGGATCFLYNFCGGHVTRSFDGGSTFEAPVALPYPPECPFPGTNPPGGYGLKSVVSRDGTVYLPFTPCERPYVAVSRDGGASWQLLSLVADTTTTGYGELALGMDQQGNLYAAFTRTADRLLYLAISKNNGLTWSAPQMIAAPGVNETAAPQLVVGKNGQVAVAYYGSTNSPGIPFPPPCSGFASVNCPGYEHETWNAYITETWDALSRQPLFWSATLNDPAQPVWYGYTLTAMQVTSANGSVTFAGGGNTLPPPGFTGIDYFGMTMALDNTPWIAIDQQCPLAKPNGNPNCSQATSGEEADGLFTLVGRLVRVHGEDDTD